MFDKRWMVFVDGENLTLRAQKLDGTGLLTTGRYYSPDVFVWPAVSKSPLSFLTEELAETELATALKTLEPRPIRAYYYTSLTGDDVALQGTRRSLWEIGFQARVFKKPKQSGKGKGVDIALATDFLSNAFLNNYDAVWLFAGDADYIPLINEVKRIGKIVFVCFFSGKESGLSPRLKLASDYFIDIGRVFFQRWYELGFE